MCSNIVQAQELDNENEMLSLQEDEITEEGESNQTTTITASYQSAVEYYITVPEEINLGILSKEAENKIPYAVAIELKNGTKGEVKIESEDAVLTKQSDQETRNAYSLGATETLRVYNTLSQNVFTGSGAIEEQWIIYPEDVQKVSQGTYTGVGNFIITYTSTATNLDSDKPDTSEPQVDDNGSDSIVPQPESNTAVPNTSEPEVDSTTGTTDVGTNGNYTAEVSMRKENNFSDASMCNVLFAKDVDILVSDNQATITIYVIDPIPTFPDDGTPLSNVIFTYSGVQYKAQVVSGGENNRYFAADGAFISSSGNYPTSKIVVTLPSAAIADSTSQQLTCQAFVNAVMKMDVNFYAVFTNVQAGQTEDLEETDNEVIDIDVDLDTTIESDFTTNTTSGTTNYSNGAYSRDDSLGEEGILDEDINETEEADESQTSDSSVIHNLNTLTKMISDSKAIRIVFTVTMCVVAAIVGYSGYIYYRRRRIDV